MRTPAQLVLVSVSVAACAAWWCWPAQPGAHGSSESAADTAPSAEQELSRLRSQIESLRSSQRQLSVELDQVAAAQPPAADAQSSGAQVPPEKAEEVDPDELVQSWVDDLEGKLLAERRDSHWEADVTTKLKNLTVAMQGTQLMETVCQATLCRVTLRYDAREDRDRFFEVNAGFEPFNNENFVQLTEERGRPGAVIYLARAGHSLELASL
jgi:hypothetical protein